MTSSLTICFANRDRSIYVMDSSNFTDMKINCIEFMMNMRHEPPTSAYNMPLYISYFTFNFDRNIAKYNI